MRTGIASGFLSALLLMACGPSPRPAPTEPAPGSLPAAVPAEDPSVSVTSLSGAWRVAAIDGRDFDEPYGLALTGDQNRLWWEPECAGMIRKYRINGRSVRFSSAHPPLPAGSPTPPVCAIGLPPRLGEVFRALDFATSIVRTPENGTLIAGGGHSLTLFSQ